MTVTLEHRFAPRGAAKELFGVRNTEVLLTGPVGTGKSRALLEKLHMMCLLNPGMRGLVLRKTFTSLTSSAVVTLDTLVLSEALESGLVVKRVEAPQYRYSNGSTITLGGMDKWTRLMSSEFDASVVVEATEFTEVEWESVLTRLRYGKVSFQQMMGDCNPDKPNHWLKTRCDKGLTKMMISKHQDNPRWYDLLPDGTFKLTEQGNNYLGGLDRSLTGVRRLRLLGGIWAAAEGLIYEDWSDRNVLNRFDIPADWPRYWAIDFGFTNPFVCQMWAEDPDGRLYLYKEVYRTKRLVEDHAKDILSLTREEPRPVAVICDHDAEGRATFEKHAHVSTTAAIKKVKEGIEAVQARVRPADDSKARIFYLRDSVAHRDPELDSKGLPCSTLEEVTGYVWDGTKEAPVKADDHGMDAMRYLVAHRDLHGEYNIRWL